MRKLCLFFVLIVIAASMPSIALAQDDDPDEPAERDELPVIPYYTSSNEGRRFNIPIPDGWNAVSTDTSYARLVMADTDVEILAIAVEAETVEAALADGLSQIDGSLATESIVTGTIRLDGLEWIKNIYRLENGGTLNLFAQERNGVFFLLMQVNPNPAVDFFTVALAAEGDAVPVEINNTLVQIYPDFTGEATSEAPVELSNGTWTRSEYTSDDETVLTTLHQERFGTTYVVIENGDGETLDSVNKAFFTVLFGFFVTPQNDNYLTLGVIAVVGLLALMVGSMVARNQSLNNDLALIQQLQEDETT